MTSSRDFTTMAADKRMIEAWATCHLPMEDAEQGRADRFAAALLIVRQAMDLETLCPGTSVLLLPD